MQNIFMLIEEKIKDKLYDDALDLVNKHLIIGSLEYQNFLALKIEILYKTDKFEEMLDIIDEELDLNNIDDGLKTVLVNIRKGILSGQISKDDDVEEKPEIAPRPYEQKSDSEIMQILSSHSAEKVEIAIEDLAFRNIRNFLVPIQKLLAGEIIKDITKTVLLGYLFDQGVVEQFKVRKNGEDFLVSPINIDDIYNLDYMAIHNQILLKVTNYQNPTLEYRVIEILYLYIISIYPESVLPVQDDALVAAAYYYVNNALGIMNSLEKIADLFHIEVSELEDYFQKLETCLIANS